MMMVNSCYRTSSKRSEDTAKKLAMQSKMHAAKIRLLDQHIHDLDIQKMNYVSQKKIAMAKKTVLERHKVMSRKTRCEQLKECCDRYLESISEFDVVRDTVGALNEAKSTFKHINIERIGMKVGEISDVVSDFRTELENTQAAIGDMNGGKDISDEELKAELDELDSLMFDDSAMNTPHTEAIQIEGKEKRDETVQNGDEEIPSKYKAAGIFA